MSQRHNENHNENADGAITDEKGLAWIPIAVAAKLVISVRPGKPTHVSTIRQFIEQGVLQGQVRRVGKMRWWYVRRDQVMALNELHEPQRE